jgi:phosphatidylglycerophosphatase A
MLFKLKNKTIIKMIFKKRLDSILHFCAFWIALGFGVGLLKGAPGSYATFIIGIPLYWIIHTWQVNYYPVLLIVIILGIVICSTASRMLNHSDDPSIVWDEVCGYLLTMLNAPDGFIWILLGFLLFRLFDIWKPWPIYIFDKHVKGGIGIILDDLLAGVYAWLCLRILCYIFR